MEFEALPLAGAFLIRPQILEDERGSFFRTFCAQEFAEKGLKVQYPQCNQSMNLKKGIIRGLHFQTSPMSEAKLFRCVKGSIFDVIVDLRPGSQTLCQSFSIELSDKKNYSIYIPEGFAHGFQSLIDDCIVTYQMSQVYSPRHNTGLRYDDPTFAIPWPLENPIVSQKDLGFSFYSPGIEKSLFQN